MNNLTYNRISATFYGGLLLTVALYISMIVVTTVCMVEARGYTNEGSVLRSSLVATESNFLQTENALLSDYQHTSLVAATDVSYAGSSVVTYQK